MLLSGYHAFVFRQVGSGDEGWMLGLHHYSDSAAIAWPVEIDTSVFTDGIALVKFKPLAAPCVVAILDMREYEGFVGVWKSWGYQRSVPNVPVEPVQRAMARAAFWNLSKSTGEVCRFFGHAIEDGLPLFEVLFQAVRFFLQTTDEETMAVMQLRFSVLPSMYEYAGDLLEVDEAAVCLDQRDRDELRKVQKSAGEVKVEHQQFAKGLRERREKIAASATNGPKRRKTTGSGIRDYAGPRKLPAIESLAQRDLKAFLPPGGGAFIWVARNISAWCTRYPPFKASTRYWRKEGGESQAAAAALRDVWLRYLEANGYPAETCLIEGLLAELGGAGSVSSSSRAPRA